MREQRVLNAGAGSDTEGTDFIDLYRAKGRSEVKICNLNSDRIPYEDNTFDRIKCQQVLAHLYKPFHALNEFHRVLKKDGVLYLTIPNPKFHSLFTNSYNGYYDEKYSRGKEDKIYMLYNMNSIGNLLSAAGFKDIKARYGFINYNTLKLKVYKSFFSTLSTLSKSTFSPQIIIEARK